MPNANVFELESCMADAARYCAEAPANPVNELFAPRIAAAKRRWDQSVADSERVELTRRLTPGNWVLEAVVDDEMGQGGSGTRNECKENNNTIVIDANFTCQN